MKFDGNNFLNTYSEERFSSGSARNCEFKFDRENSTNFIVRVHMKISRQIVSSRFVRKYKCKFDPTNFQLSCIVLNLKVFRRKFFFALRAKV